MLFFAVNFAGAPIVFENSIEVAGANFSFRSSKVITIEGPIVPDSIADFQAKLYATRKLRGDLVLILDSPGGYVDTGETMLGLLELEQKIKGFQLICVVRGRAHSMAFNILSHCNKKYSTPNAKMIVHKIRAQLEPRPMTAEMLREVAKELDQSDEPYRQLNSKLMHLTLPEYDDYAKKETSWTAEELLARGYLDGIVMLHEDQPTGD